VPIIHSELEKEPVYGAYASHSHFSLLSKVTRNKYRPENVIIYQFILQRQPNSIPLLFMNLYVKKIPSSRQCTEIVPQNVLLDAVVFMHHESQNVVT